MNKGKGKNPKARRGRFAYAENYEKNEKGEYENRGQYYDWEGSAQEEKHYCRFLLAISALTLILSLGAGCIPAPGLTGERPYLLPLYVINLPSCARLFLASWRIFREKESMREHVYQKSVKRLPGLTGAVFLSAVGLAAGEVLFLFWGETTENAREGILFCGMALLLAGAALAVWKKKMAERWKLRNSDD